MKYWIRAWWTYHFRRFTSWKVSKYGVISGPYFPVFSPNTGKKGPEITPHLDTFHTVQITCFHCIGVSRQWISDYSDIISVCVETYFFSLVLSLSWTVTFKYLDLFFFSGPPVYVFLVYFIAYKAWRCTF